MKKYNQVLYYKIAKFQNKYKLSYNYSVRSLIRDLGIKLVEYKGIDVYKLTQISDDGFSVVKDGHYYIVYNPYIHKNRQNFTIAHELGHIALGHHRFMMDRLLASGSNNTILENHANIFARNLLMPVKVTTEFKDLKSTDELAELFEVSEAMVKVRLDVLEEDIKGFASARMVKL